ncbi:ABC transporter ATP-binding protein [Legionella jamestowniensis]|uniref:ABC transporter ATP-binding protein n=1 Tax=Legionella jamestowniensis TaxID=455 RepID=A0A0W0UW68_9GAMM|nr:ABC transporter ATP-binding protein [Legionella jamestowniensis]KTD12130.1 ABC transporter ATP-binding protein [Legionella jamestowniensis]OCH97780.1 hypothetical protein A8135_13505 [Legionella jamestowniensis]SFM04594.1 ABC-2 type transport system ATP-binding protein [Legionella jamestowniensis DSM 19215]
MLNLIKVSKKLSGKQIINNISCEVEQGILHICGENGSGKSTLLNMMAGSLPPDEGIISYSGVDIFNKKSRQIKKSIGYVPALAPIYPFLTGSEFLKFICQTKNAEWPSELIETFNLKGQLNTSFASMSYGTKKKFLFVSGVLASPQYLLLDEPINGLDQHSMTEMYKVLTNHLERKNGICVIISHDISWIKHWRENFSYQIIEL